MENSFQGIRSNIEESLEVSISNTDEFTTAEDPVEAGLVCTWAEPVVDNGYSYINAGTCPDCGTGMVRQGNCFSCPSCGWGCCG